MISFKPWDVNIGVILASFVDCDDWEEIHEFVIDNYSWLKSFLQMSDGIPKASSYERIISIMDTNELSKILLMVVKEIVPF